MMWAYLRRRGVVPIAIADALKLSDRTVPGYFLEVGPARSSLAALWYAEALS